MRGRHLEGGSHPHLAVEEGRHPHLAVERGRHLHLAVEGGTSHPHLALVGVRGIQVGSLEQPDCQVGDKG